MQVVQTAGVPPNQGKIIFPNTGCTKKSRKAPKKMEIAEVKAMMKVEGGVTRCV
jgi:hypothetical protein